jgi:hypothetical protein
MPAAKSVPFRLQGYIALLGSEHSAHFWVKEKQRTWNAREKRFDMRDRSVPFFRQVNETTIAVPFGAILHYNRLDTGTAFRVSEKLGGLPFRPLRLDHPAIAALELDDVWQAEALRRMAVTRGGLIEAPTGAGKSRPLAAVAIAAALQHNVLFATPGTTVEENFTETFDRLGPDLLGDLRLVDYDDYRRRPDRYPEAGCIIYAGSGAVLNDLEAGVADLRTVGTLIADEAHHGGSETYQNMLYALPNLVRSYGLSATLFDGKVDGSFRSLKAADAAVIAAHGPLLLQVRPQQVAHRIDLPDVLNLRVPWEKGERARTNNWPAVYKKVKTHARRRAVVAGVIRMLVRLDRVVTVPVGDKAYARQLMAEAGDPKVCCWFGGGEMYDLSGRHDVDIAHMRDCLNDGTYNVLIATSHIDEALDIPEINTTFLTEGKKARRARQRAGRSVRRSAVKSVVINLWDLDDGILQRQSAARCANLADYYETQKYGFDSVAAIEEYLRTL